MKFRNSIILLISMCVLCMFGLFMTNEIRKRSTDWQLIVDGVAVSQETMVFDGFMVVPGGSDEYTVRVTPVASVNADLIISFSEMENAENSPLKDYTKVAVSVKGKQVFDDKLLADLFTSDDYKQVIQIEEGEPFDIDIKFYLPEDVGNEVKTKTVDFYVYLTIENQVVG